MKFFKIGFAALAATLAFAAEAASVSVSDAKCAATGWAAARTKLGVSFGASAQTATAYAVTNGHSFYAVDFAEGGTLLLTGDTEMEPVIGFSASKLDLSKRSPLRYLLECDIALRAAQLPKKSVATAAAGSASSAMTAAAVRASRNAGSWQQLIAAGSAPSVSVLGVVTAAAKRIEDSGEIDDMRVKPILTTEWDQDYVGSRPCYNRYTPDNSVCGCTATALAQIMRYFCYPNQAEPKTFVCKYNGKEKSLTTKGGPYAWDLMVDSPDDNSPDNVLDAIGMLTYDCGVSIGSSYTTTLEGTSAFLVDATKSLRDYFGYGSAYMYGGYTTSTGLHEHSARKRLIYTNLDSGRPVQLSIDSVERGGHSVVADGYGFASVGAAEDTPFVHLNMGWSDPYAQNFWYNIPDVDADGYHATYLRGASFNIDPTKSGFEILSGRVVDLEGEKVMNAVVRVYESGVEVAVTNSDAYGIFSFDLPGKCAYTVTAVTADGKFSGEFESAITLGKTSCDSNYQITDASKVGNCWAGDLTIGNQTCYIVRDSGAKTNMFMRLDRALAAAEEGETVYVLGDTELKSSVEVTAKDVTVVADADSGYVSILRKKDAVVTVAEGAKLTLGSATSPVAFSGSHVAAVDVASNGVLRIAGEVDFGTGTEIAVKTAAPDALELAYAIDGEFKLACSVSRLEGYQFGTVAPGAEAAAGKIRNAYDEYNEISGVAAEGKLVWKVQELDPESAYASGYFVDSFGKTNCYGRLDRVFERFSAAMDGGSLPADAELVVIGSNALSRTLAVKSDLTIRGIRNAEIHGLADATFATVADGAKLVFSGIAVDDYKGPGLFKVNDGELVFGSGTAVVNAKATDQYAAAVQVYGGKFTMLEGSSITGCDYDVFSSGNGYGGAVYLDGDGCSLVMEGGKILNCHAKSYGGAVYAYAGASVSVRGATSVKGNTSGTSPNIVADDLYLFKYKSNTASLTLAGELTGDVGVKWYDNEKNLAGGAFVSVASMSLSKAQNSTAHFFADTDATLSAAYEQGDDKMTWSAAPTVPQPVDRSVAEAAVVVGSTTNCYATLKDAFDAQTAAGEVLLLKDCTFSSDLSVRFNTTLTTEDGVAMATVTRNGDCSLVVSGGVALTVTNLTFDGNEKITATLPLVYVEGGELTLGAGATVTKAIGQDSRAANGVVVWNGGTVTMLAGSLIDGCKNNSDRPEDIGQGAGCGGGLLVDGKSTAYLNGGAIRNCVAYRGGVCLANESTAYVSGGFTVADCKTLDGAACNMLVHDSASLVMNGELTGTIGWTPGIGSDSNTFGTVSVKLGADKLVSSAANFANDVTGAYGVAVTNSTKGAATLLVWSKAICADGSYTNADGKAYWVVGPIPVNTKTVSPLPIAISKVSLDTASSLAQVTIDSCVKGCWYSLYTSEDVEDSYGKDGSAPVKTFQAAKDGPVTLTVPLSGSAMFFSATANEGTVKND